VGGLRTFVAYDNIDNPLSSIYEEFSSIKLDAGLS
jgi:hypothetical protein